MAKDRRYTTVRNLISAGYIHSFREIFDTLPKSVVAGDLNINNNRFSYLMVNVEYFTLGQVFGMADLLEISHDKMMDLVLQQHLADKKHKKQEP